jgi:hypothetical protein
MDEGTPWRNVENVFQEQICKTLQNITFPHAHAMIVNTLSLG